MKGLFFMLLTIGFVFGAITLKLTQDLTRTKYEVGECVRELGHNAVEVITEVTEGGAIETGYSNIANVWGISVYDNSVRLTKVDCSGL